MKKSLLICILAVICVATLAFSACTPTQHTVTIIAEDGSQTVLTVKHGEAIAPADIEGQELFTDSQCTQRFDPNTAIVEDITLYAKRGEQTVDSCVVSFETNGGTAVQSVTVTKGEKLPSGITTSKQNHQFVGWYTDSACTQQFDANMPINDSFTLYAKWERTHYTVTLKVFSRKLVVNVAVGDKLNLSGQAESIGYDDIQYIFECWVDEAGNQYGGNDIIDVTNDITLTAQFESVDVLYVLDESGEFYIVDDVFNEEMVRFEIPETHDGLPVRAINFLGTSPVLEEIIIPDSVTFIAEGAFGSLPALQTIDAPFLGAELISSLPTGDDFVGKEGIFGYWFRENPYGVVQRRGYYAIPTDYYVWDTDELGDYRAFVQSYFEIPASLKTVTIRNGVIPEIGFYNAVTIEKVVLGDKVTAMGKRAFSADSRVENLPIKFRAVEFGENSEFTTFTENAFRSSYLVEINIPNGVTVLPKELFYDCLYLENVTFAEDSQLTTIEQEAFYVPFATDPASLQYITLPESLTTIGMMAFCNSSALKSITIPANVTTIGGAAFRSALSLESVVFAAGNAMTELEGSVFETCRSLTTVVLPDTISVLGSSVFSGCALLKEDQFDFSKINEIGNAAFNDTGFVTVMLPANVTKFGSSVFANCDDLVTAQLNFAYSADVNLLNTFDDCDSLTSVTFPFGVTEIGVTMFRNCKSLTTITIPASVKTIGSYAFGGMVGGITNVIFENGSVLEEIGDHAFNSRERLTSISFPSSIKKIGASAFEFCYGLTTVTIAEETENLVIEANAFRRNFRLTSINLTGVVSIGSFAFEDCISLESIAIPASVESIGENAFATSDSDRLQIILAAGLTLADVKDLEIHIDVLEADVVKKNWPSTWCGNATVTYKEAGADTPIVYNDGTWQGLLTLSDKTITITQYIGSEAVVALPDTLEYNGEEYELIWSASVFANNTTITSVAIGLTEIPDYFFSSCSNLVEVKVPSGIVVTRIGDYAFYNTLSMTTCTIDFSNVEYLGDYAFSSGSGRAMAFTGDVQLSSKLTYLGERAFYNCSKAKIYINDAFTNLTTIPQRALSYTVLYVGDDGVLTIPSNIVSIGEAAFNMSREAGNITAIVIDANRELTIGASAFSSMSFYNQNMATKYQMLAYILVKGTPKCIGSLFAGNNYYGVSSSYRTPLFFEDMEFDQPKISGAVNNLPDGWDAMWYCQNYNDDEDKITYRPVYGKGTWHYENGVPTAGVAKKIMAGTIAIDYIYDTKREQV